MAALFSGGAFFPSAPAVGEQGTNTGALQEKEPWCQPLAFVNSSQFKVYGYGLLTFWAFNQ
jgi:hypothetical protein